MGRSKGAVTCPVHQKQLLSKCQCLRAYGHGVVTRWKCPSCGDDVPWTKNWTDKARKPFHHASGACVAKSSTLVEAKVREPHLLTIPLILLLTLFQEMGLTSPSPPEREETAPLTCSPCPVVEVLTFIYDQLFIVFVHSHRAVDTENRRSSGEAP